MLVSKQEVKMFKKWLQSLSIYADRRMLTMIGLGFSSGFPLLLVSGTLSLWLKDSGLSYALIGAFALVKSPYSFKWAWSPLIDRIRLPLFCRLGRRRGWALFTQILLMLAIFTLSRITPSVDNWQLVAFLAMAVVFCSASQDIVVDSFRIDSFEDTEQGAGSAVFVLGYRIGMIFSGAFALMLADHLSWNEVYSIMSMGALIGIITILFSKEPEKDKSYYEPSADRLPFWPRLIRFLRRSIVAPFTDFMRHNKWYLILIFILLFRLSDDYKAPMANLFYDDMGFTKAQIGYASKIYGMIATIIGGLIGGLVVGRKGLRYSLMLTGILQGLTNLVYIAQAYAGNNIYMLGVTICADNLAGGMATTALVAYLSSLCSVAYTATQYALLSSLMSITRDVVSSSSGYVAGQLSWPAFFLCSALLVLPALILLGYMINKDLVKK